MHCIRKCQRRRVRPWHIASLNAGASVAGSAEHECPTFCFLGLRRLADDIAYPNLPIVIRKQAPLAYRSFRRKEILSMHDARGVIEANYCGTLTLDDRTVFEPLAGNL